MLSKEESKRRVYARNEEWRKNNRQYFRDYHIKMKVLAKEKLWNILGHSCKSCGYNDKRALQFDHINNDGNIARKQFGNLSSQYGYLSRRPELALSVLQILCANCHCIKHNYNKRS